MCQALEERSIGREEGRQEGADEIARIIVKNMLIRGMSDEDIMAIAECDQEFVNKVRMNLE